MTVIAAVELDDVVALCESARQTDRAHGRLRAGICHANFLDARNKFTNQLRHFDFEWIRNSKTCAAIGGGFDGGNYFRMRMAENRRSPGADIINQFISVHVPYVRAF